MTNFLMTNNLAKKIVNDQFLNDQLFRQKNVNDQLIDDQLRWKKNLLMTNYFDIRIR